MKRNKKELEERIKLLISEMEKERKVALKHLVVIDNLFKEIKSLQKELEGLET